MKFWAFGTINWLLANLTYVREPVQLSLSYWLDVACVWLIAMLV